jgi:hypothetical protein
MPKEPSSWLWTWPDEDIALEITGLMIRFGNDNIPHYDGSITDFSITAKGMTEFTMLEHSIDELEIPVEPVIDGPTNGRAGAEYSYTIKNSATENLYFCVDWGDNTPVEWTELIAPGSIATVKHTWTEEGTYTIQARGINEHGCMSEWAELSISIPRKRVLISFLQIFLKNQPFIYQLLKQFYYI